MLRRNSHVPGVFAYAKLFHPRYSEIHNICFWNRSTCRELVILRFSCVVGECMDFDDKSLDVVRSMSV